MRWFSTRDRPPHLGPYPLERLQRVDAVPNLLEIPSVTQNQNRDGKTRNELSIVHAIDEYQSMLDAIRIGFTNRKKAECPVDPVERADHLKSFGYFSDASMVGICQLDESTRLTQALINPQVKHLAEQLSTRQTKTLASGIDAIMADLKESMEAPPVTIEHHTHAIVFLYEFPRDPESTEPGCEWIQDAQSARAGLRAAETAVVIANYLRLLGYESKAHTSTSTDVDLNRLVVLAGLAQYRDKKLFNPYVGDRFGVAVVTTTFDMACDLPLAPDQMYNKTHGLAWTYGWRTQKNKHNQTPYANRRFVDGEHPFEKLNRVNKPTTYIDEARVARVPKRTDMFARSQFGDMGTHNQNAARGGRYVNKSAPSSAQRRVLGACVLLQDGEPAARIHPSTRDATLNADNIKATAYFLGIDAVGISSCPDWTWYSHDAAGEPIDPPHDQAISMVVDQGFETMEGASGDDWIAVAQSMRAYLRFSVLGGIVANHIRRLGYYAKAHTVLDGEVLQPPLLLLSGLGEVSRIGEVILNPFLGPRLKSGVVTTTMPLAHDKPIDFGLQRFCEQCNKCARECPSGAITAGPKLMFNGYEIWKSDSQKCTTYRLTTEGGAMCGRCMKTCPWNLEGLFVEAPFRWTAMNVPSAAPWLAKLDDFLGNGERNPVKKWWWDIEQQEDGGYSPTVYTVNCRDLQKNLKIDYKQQTLAVYPADLAPPPWPYPFPMDREKGIAAYQSLVDADEYQRQLNLGEEPSPRHVHQIQDESPVIRVRVSCITKVSDSLNVYQLTALNQQPLPSWQAGAHVDVVVAPEYIRPYSLTGDPADRSHYHIAVAREDSGTGGSKLLHRIFTQDRIVVISKPRNHFALNSHASHSILMAAGIGITPLYAMALELRAKQHSYELHYSFKTKDKAAFINEFEKDHWADHVNLYPSEINGRIQLGDIIPDFRPGSHLYVCGPASYIDEVLSTAEKKGYSEDHRHTEYFSVPELPEYENHPFHIQINGQTKQITVAEDESAAEALVNAGYGVSLKCSDGLCGVCQCKVIAGNIEHRDFVLSQSQRETQMILCRSRAKSRDETLIIELPDVG